MANKAILSVVVVFLVVSVAVGIIVSADNDAARDLPQNNIDQALQGRVSGVQITAVDDLGGYQYRISGVRSLAGNEPLYIVDGMGVSNIQYLDPSMIESMEILKDAASAAIYGAEAGNGVILITTTHGADAQGTTAYGTTAYGASEAEVDSSNGVILVTLIMGLAFAAVAVGIVIKK